jgi:hypothetical protein
MESHLVAIEEDMLKTQKENTIKSKAQVQENDVDTKKKRNQLSKATIANVNMMAGRRVVQFD